MSTTTTENVKPKRTFGQKVKRFLLITVAIIGGTFFSIMALGTYLVQQDISKKAHAAALDSIDPAGRMTKEQREQALVEKKAAEAIARKAAEEQAEKDRKAQAEQREQARKAQAEQEKQMKEREAQAKREAAEREKTLPIAQKENKDLVGACTLAQMQIERVLKAPSTASFESCGNMRWQVNGGIITIQMNVDAQNSFGAKLRNTFEVKLNGTGQDWLTIPAIPPRVVR